MNEHDNASSEQPAADKSGRTSVLLHIAGSRRGAMDTLPAGRTLIGTGLDATVHFVTEREPAVAEHHAEVVEDEGRVEIRALGDQPLLVNGRAVDQLVLAPGDVIQIGEDGPVLRYRFYTGELSPYKTPVEALRDCLANARHCAETPVGQARAFAGAMPGEVVQLAPTVRWGMAGAMVLVLAALAGLGYHSYMLEQRLEQRAERIETVSARLAATERQSVGRELVEDLEARLAGSLQRIDELETRVGAVSDVIAGAAGSVVFIQGAYGFVDPITNERLRMALDEAGDPMEAPSGQVRVRIGGDGPPVERSYTGTAFVAGDEGFLLTNRHVAEPWAFDDRAQRVIDRGLEPHLVRMLGYLPGRSASFDVEMVTASDEVDLAVLRGGPETRAAESLPLAETSPQVGEEVVLLGYPTGIRALLARADPELVQGLEDDREVDFWRVAARLSEEEAIEPLATSGIVGQVTRDRVVYDAGTTGGGSGGPLLNHAGQVVAVNQAMVRDFQGSNLGVPVERVRELLEQARAQQ